MKAKHILSFIAVLAISVVNNDVFSQVKIGANPTTIAATSNLEVEATDGTKVSVSKANGSVGIGTTTIDPNSKLDVNGAIMLRKTSALEGGQINIESGTSAKNWFIDQIDNGNPQLRIVNGTSPVMHILENGNVGLGTSSPSAKLEVNSATPNVSGLKLTNLTQSTPVSTGQSIGVDATGNVVTIASGAIPTITRVYSTTTSTNRLKNVWSDVAELTITVPAGNSILAYNVYGFMEAASGGLIQSVVIYDVTANVLVPNSQRYVSSVSAVSPSGGSVGAGTATFEMPLSLTSPHTYKLQWYKQEAGSPSVNNDPSYIVAGSYIEYRK